MEYHTPEDRIIYYPLYCFMFVMLQIYSSQKYVARVKVEITVNEV